MQRPSIFHSAEETSSHGQPTVIFRFQFAVHSSAAKPLSKIPFSLHIFPRSPWPIGCSTNPEGPNNYYISLIIMKKSNLSVYRIFDDLIQFKMVKSKDFILKNVVKPNIHGDIIFNHKWN